MSEMSTDILRKFILFVKKYISSEISSLNLNMSDIITHNSRRLIT